MVNDIQSRADAAYFNEIQSRNVLDRNEQFASELIRKYSAQIAAIPQGADAPVPGKTTHIAFLDPDRKKR